ncbi:MAG: cell division protein FtsA [Deltaproteobacteria bacterium]|nr:cell division protein FtsA [Deltaproteobacteria bacterium]
MASNELLVGLDVGTTKVCCLVAAPNQNGGLDIRGMGTSRSRGMRKGMVVNIESTVESIREAVAEAQGMAGCQINSAYLGVAGGHVSSFNSSGMIGVGKKMISEEDISRVYDSALAIATPMDREVLHTVVQEYKVDDQVGIIDPPLGMTGVRLEVQVHVITGAVNAVRNLINCVMQAGLEVNEIVLESVASAEAVLTPEDKELGVALLDFGGGTTDIAIYSGQRIRHSAVLAMGGNNLTRDLSQSYHISLESAEKLKIEHGCCNVNISNDDEFVDIVTPLSATPLKIQMSNMRQLLCSRIDEIMFLINSEFVRCGYDELIHEVVITGGSSLLRGATEVVKIVLDRPVRLGLPGQSAHIGGLAEIVSHPSYSTAVGLCLFALNRGGGGFRNVNFNRNESKSFFKKIIHSLSSFFSNKNSF